MTGEVRWVHKGRDIAGTSGVPVIVDDRVLAARTPGWIAAYALGDGELFDGGAVVAVSATGLVHRP